MKWENKNKRKLGPLGTINQLWCVSNIIIGYDEHIQIHEYPSMLMWCVRLCDFQCFLFLNWLLIWNFCFFSCNRLHILTLCGSVFYFAFGMCLSFYSITRIDFIQAWILFWWRKKNKFMHIPWIMNQWSFASHRIVYGKKWPSIWFNLHPPTHTHRWFFLPGSFFLTTKCHELRALSYGSVDFFPQPPQAANLSHTYWDHWQDLNV